MTTPTIQITTSVTTSQIINNILTGFISYLSPMYPQYATKFSQLATTLYNACTGTGDISQVYWTTLVQTIAGPVPGTTQPDPFWAPVVTLINAESPLGLTTPATSLVIPPALPQLLRDLLKSTGATAFSRTLIPTYTPMLLSTLYAMGLALAVPGSNPPAGSTVAEILALRYTALWADADIAPVVQAINTWLQAQTSPITQAAFVQGIVGVFLTYFPNLSVHTLQYLTAYLLIINVPVTTTNGVIYSQAYQASTTSTIASLQAMGVAQWCVTALKISLALTIPADTLEASSIANLLAINAVSAISTSATAAAASATAAANSATGAANSATQMIKSIQIQATAADTSATAATNSARAAADSATAVSNKVASVVTLAVSATQASIAANNQATQAAASAAAAAASAKAAATAAQGGGKQGSLSGSTDSVSLPIWYSVANILGVLALIGVIGVLIFKK